METKRIGSATAYRWGDKEVRVQISAKSWSVLAEKLSLVHEKPAPPLRAIQIVEGWIEQIGPCFLCEERDQVVSRIAAIGAQLAFDELPDAEELLERWREAYSRWLNIYQSSSMSASLTTLLSDYPVETGDSSADRHDFCAESIRTAGNSWLRSSSQPEAFMVFGSRNRRRRA